MWHVIYCDRETINFHKDGERNGHLTSSAATWMCFDSDAERTWQPNYILSACFLFYLGKRESSSCVWPLQFKTCMEKLRLWEAPGALVPGYTCRRTVLPHSDLATRLNVVRC